MQQGSIKFFIRDKGYGFIQPADGSPDVFLHAKEAHKGGLYNPTEGMAVQFDAAPGKDGKPKAVRVEAVK